MKINNVLWRLVFIALGIILALNSFGIINVNFFFDGWWTLFIIVPCFIDLFKKGEEKTGNLIGLVIGVVLLLACQDVINPDLIGKLFFPAVLVVFGLSFIFKNTINSEIHKKIKEINLKNNEQTDKQTKEYISTFSLQKLDFNNEAFNGCSLSAVFGGIELDLRNAVIENDVVINTTSVFGGIDIVVSNDVIVEVTSNSIFGGVSKKTNPKPNLKNPKTIYINATSIFGGVDIK